VTVARAPAMAVTCAAERVERDPMPPVLLAMAVWIRAAVAPALAELASGPWHPAQLEPYSVGPSRVGVGVGVGAGVTVARTPAMAATCAAESVERDPMPPVLPAMAVWIRLAVAPALAEVASGPWHPAQLEPYRVAPSRVGVGVGVGGGVTVVRAPAMAVTCAAERVEREPMPPVLPAMAVWIRLAVAPSLLELASTPWHPAQLLLYRAAPSSTGVGVGVGVEGVNTVTSA